MVTWQPQCAGASLAPSRLLCMRVVVSLTTCRRVQCHLLRHVCGAHMRLPVRRSGCKYKPGTLKSRCQGSSAFLQCTPPHLAALSALVPPMPPQRLAQALDLMCTGRPPRSLQLDTLISCTACVDCQQRIFTGRGQVVAVRLEQAIPFGILSALSASALVCLGSADWDYHVAHDREQDLPLCRLLCPSQRKTLLPS